MSAAFRNVVGVIVSAANTHSSRQHLTFSVLLCCTYMFGKCAAISSSSMSAQVVNENIFFFDASCCTCQ